jgi:thiamine kinase-like enzyme
MIKEVLKNWDIEVSSIAKLNCDSNPFNNLTHHIINDKYFLKTYRFEILEQLKKEIKIIELLGKYDVPLLRPIDDKIVQAKDKLFVLYDYLPRKNSQDVFLTDFDPFMISFKLGNIINVPKTKFEKINHCDYESLKTEFEKITPIIKKKSKSSIDKIEKGITLIEKNLLPYLKFFNRQISHGDLHPNNILFDSNDIPTFIDWELSCIREELYDFAFIIGCIVINNPEELNKEWLRKFIQSYITNNKPSKLSVTLLPELILAIRFKWLYKWLEYEADKDMIEMEIMLIDIFIKNIDNFRKSWLNLISSDFKYSKNKWVMQDTYIVEEINKAKDRHPNLDLNDISYFETYDDIGALSTDLRLIGIEYGMNDDIISVIKILNIFDLLCEKNPTNPHLLIENIIMQGNCCLDFSKFQMVEGIKYLLNSSEKLVKNNDNIDELKIGYAIILRNTSIAYAELHLISESFEIIDKLVKLSNINDSVEIKKELSRALSNGITTMLHNNLQKSDKFYDYTSLLKILYKENPNSKKIHGAYQIAKVNLKKKDIDIE